MTTVLTYPLQTYSFPAMGGDCLFHLEGELGMTDKAAEAAMAEVFRIETAYSRYVQDNVLFRINEAAGFGGSVWLDAETAGLIAYAFACHQKSGGLFDITSGVLRRAWDFSSGRVPPQAEIDRLLPLIGCDKLDWNAQTSRLAFPIPGMEIDLGGIGKEYAADRAADVCLEWGITSGLVNLGGDIRVIGPHVDGEPWIIHVRSPHEPDVPLASIPIAHGAIASSGDYERFVEEGGRRYGHILDPRTGWPVAGLSSVSVVAERCLVAGSVATIAILKGREGISWLASLGLRHLWCDDAGQCGDFLAA